MPDLLELFDQTGKPVEPAPRAPQPAEDSGPLSGLMDRHESALGSARWWDQSVPAQERLENFLQTNLHYRRNWKEVEAEGKKYFDQIPEAVKAGYEKTYKQEKMMDEARAWQRSRQTGSLAEELAVATFKPIPFLHSGISADAQLRLKAAMGRYQKGEATFEDAYLIAELERRAEVTKDQNLLTKIAQGVASVPAVIGEAQFGGAALKGLGVISKAAPTATEIAAPLTLRGAAAAAPRYLATQAAQTPFMPSLYAERWAQAGGEIKNLPPALALGTTQNVALGLIGRAARGIPGEGLGPGVKRLFIGVGSGMGAQQAADLATSATAAATKIDGLDTGYGLLGTLFREGPGPALEEATVQAATFTAFGLAHAPHKDPLGTLRPMADALKDLKSKGYSLEEASARVSATGKRLAQALGEDPTLTRAEAEKLFENLPKGKLRDYAVSLADGLPTEKPAPAGPHTVEPVPFGPDRPPESPAEAKPPAPPEQRPAPQPMSPEEAARALQAEEAKLASSPNARDVGLGKPAPEPPEPATADKLTGEQLVGTEPIGDLGPREYLGKKVGPKLIQRAMKGYFPAGEPIPLLDLADTLTYQTGQLVTPEQVAKAVSLYPKLKARLAEAPKSPQDQPAPQPAPTPSPPEIAPPAKPQRDPLTGEPFWGRPLRPEPAAQPPEKPSAPPKQVKGAEVRQSMAQLEARWKEYEAKLADLQARVKEGEEVQASEAAPPFALDDVFGSARLTEKERGRVMARLEGRSLDQIAAEEGVSRQAVEISEKKAMAKLGKKGLSIAEGLHKKMVDEARQDLKDQADSILAETGGKEEGVAKAKDELAAQERSHDELEDAYETLKRNTNADPEAVRALERLLEEEARRGIYGAAASQTPQGSGDAGTPTRSRASLEAEIAKLEAKLSTGEKKIDPARLRSMVEKSGARSAAEWDDYAESNRIKMAGKNTKLASLYADLAGASAAEPPVPSPTTPPESRPTPPQPTKTVDVRLPPETRPLGAGLPPIQFSYLETLVSKGMSATGAVKSWLKGWLTAEGKKPHVIDRLHRDAVGRIAAEAELAKQSVNDLKKAIGDYYRLVVPDPGLIAKARERLQKMAPDILGDPNMRIAVLHGFGEYEVKVINSALKGNISSLYQLPGPVRDAVINLRGNIDVLSQAAIRENVVDAEMEVAFDQNIGFYLHRSYEKHRTPGWTYDFLKRVDPETLTYFTRWLKGEMTRAMGETPSEKDLEIETRRLLVEGGASDNPIAFLSKHKLGSKDVGILKSQQDIPEPVRRLFGEREDAAVNYLETTHRLSHLVHNHVFLKQALEAGRGTIFFDLKGEEAVRRARQEAEEGGFTWKVRELSAIKQEASARAREQFAQVHPGVDPVRVAEKGDPTMEPLAGQHVHPDVKAAFADIFAPKQVQGIWKLAYRIANFAKYSKTVLSHVAHIGNTVSNFLTTISEGHLNPLHTKAVLEALVMDSPVAREKRLEYARQHVLHQGIAEGEFREAIQDIYQQRGISAEEALFHISDRRIADYIKKGLKVPEKVYHLEDSIFRAFGYENFKAEFRKAYPEWTEEQVQARAGEELRLRYPTYSMRSPLVQALSKFLMAAPFISWPAEVARTLKNKLLGNLRLMADPRTFFMGFKKMLALGAVAVLPSAIAAWTRSANGLTAQDDEDMRRFDPPWGRDDVYAHLPGGKRLNLSRMDAYSYIRNPILRTLAGDPKEGLKLLAEPFFKEELFSQRLIDVARNTKSTGGQVYNEQEERPWIGPSSLAHISGSLTPGSIESFTKGRPLGTWLVEQDLPKSLKHKAQGFTFDQKDASGILRKAVKAATVSDQELIGAWRKAEEAHRRLFDELREDVLAARRLGLSHADARMTLMRGGLTPQEAKNVLEGKYVPFVPDQDYLQPDVKPGPADLSREELRRRVKVVRQAASASR